MSKVTRDERRRMIAEAAYFRAERRGFNGGDSVGDWIQAEAEVDEHLRQAEQTHLLQSLEDGIATATKTLSAMKRKASTVAVGARATLQRDVAQLGELRDAVRAKAEALRAQGTRAGEIAVHQAERAWRELADAMSKLGTPPSH